MTSKLSKLITASVLGASATKSLDLIQKIQIIASQKYLAEGDFSKAQEFLLIANSITPYETVFTIFTVGTALAGIYHYVNREKE